jgi:hypothetical protein
MTARRSLQGAGSMFYCPDCRYVGMEIVVAGTVVVALSCLQVRFVLVAMQFQAMFQDRMNRGESCFFSAMDAKSRRGSPCELLRMNYCILVI